MKIVLFEPEIPQNTGNIVRTCALTNSGLILVRPLGFSTSNRMLKRAGLDYWRDISVEFIDDLPAYLTSCTSRFFFFSSHASAIYTTPSYRPDDLLIFGNETKGLPKSFHTRWLEHFYKIPIFSAKGAEQRLNCPKEIPTDWSKPVRSSDSGCLNLSNAVSIVLYEGLRQQGFMP